MIISRSNLDSQDKFFIFAVLMRSSDDCLRYEPPALCVLTDMLASPPASPESNRSVCLRVWSSVRPRILRRRGVEKGSSSKCLRIPAARNCLVHPGPEGPESADVRDERRLCICALAVQIFPCQCSFWV